MNKNTNLSSAKVYRKILAEIKDMPEKELLSQSGYYALLNKIAVSMLQENEYVTLNCVSHDSDETGVTNGQIITVNTWSPLVLYVQNMLDYIEKNPTCDWTEQLPTSRNERQLMYLSNVGTVVHEFGHVMYTDFDLLVRIRNKMTRGNFDGCDKKEKLEKLMKTSFSKVIESAVMDVTNILEDCYIENCIKKAYPPTGTASKGLDIANSIKFFLSNPMTELESKVASGEMLFVDLFVWMLQIKCCLGYTPKEWDKCSGNVHSVISEALDRALPVALDYKESSKNHEKDVCLIMDIIADLLPDNPNEQQQEQNQSGNGESNESEGEESGEGSGRVSGSQQNSSGSKKSQSGSGSSNSNGEKSEEDLINGQKVNNQTSDSSEEARSNSGQSNQESISNNRGKAKRKDTDEVKTSKEASQTCSENEDTVSKQMATQEAEHEKANEQERSLNEAIQEMKGYFPRSDIGVTSESSSNAPSNKAVYDRHFREIEQISKKCVRQISQILKKRNYEDTQSGYLYGSKFNPSEAYREDGKCFSRRLVPDATPDVAFSIMVDESGSMHGSKNEMARRAAILFDDVSRKLDIPTRIVGHTTSHSGVVIKNYVNFRSKESEKYTLGSIDAFGGNVDTYVLTALCEEMLKRKEKSKVVIVVSDGAPCGTTGNANNFRGIQYKTLNSKNSYIANDEADQELNACVRFYRKKGLKIIGVALDDDESIKAIYEEGTLDCTDLSRLPSEMVKLFKKYVLK